MPYLRDRSPFYQVRRRTLVGVGDTGVLSTRTTNKALAERMERALLDVAERALYEPSYRAVVDAVLDRTISLPDLLSAHARGAVGELRTALVDPPLAQACARYVEMGRGRKKGRGREAATRVLLALAPARARLSWLRDPKHVERMCYAAERGEPAQDGELTPRKRNSVRRTLYRAVSLILKAEVGQAERDRILSAVDFPGEDDTREVALTAADVARLIEACHTMHQRVPTSGYDELAVAIRLMLQTSADRGTLFRGRNAGGAARGLEVRQVRIYSEGDGDAETFSGEVYLADTKTAARSRTVPITDGMCRQLIPLCAAKTADAPVFSLSYGQVDARWRRVRELANLPGLRIKDLRAQTAIAAEMAGVPQTVVVATMGHSDEKMTRRYQSHRAAMTGEHAEAIERQLGLTGS